MEQNNVVKPVHYNKGLIDLFEASYLTRPFSEHRAVMEFVAERYMKRDKDDRLNDIDKSIYTLQRLREYEVRHAESTENEKAEETIAYSTSNAQGNGQDC